MNKATINVGESITTSSSPLNSNLSNRFVLSGTISSNTELVGELSSSFLKGVGITNITQIQSSNDSGGENILKLSLSNGETCYFIVKNGLQGNQGEDGTSATISIGNVTTLTPGSAAVVENVGTDKDAILNFGIPSGGIENVDLTSFVKKEELNSFKLNHSLSIGNKIFDGSENIVIEVYDGGITDELVAELEDNSSQMLLMENSSYQMRLSSSNDNMSMKNTSNQMTML